MEKINFRAVERSTQDVSVTIKGGNSERWDIQSQKTKYVNGKLSGVIEVGYTASLDNTTKDYLLEEDKGNKQIQITAHHGATSGLCILKQNESGNQINLHLTTPEENEYWEIRFTPNHYSGVNMDASLSVSTNISGENGSMADNGTLYKNWIVNQNRHTINIYISTNIHSGTFDILSWSCFNKNGNAFSTTALIPSYSPDNPCFTIEKSGLGSYTLTKVENPSVDNGTLVLSRRFNSPKKYPLDLNFYWGLKGLKNI